MIDDDDEIDRSTEVSMAEVVEEFRRPAALNDLFARPGRFPGDTVDRGRLVLCRADQGRSGADPRAELSDHLG